MHHRDHFQHVRRIGAIDDAEREAIQEHPPCPGRIRRSKDREHHSSGEDLFHLAQEALP